MSESVETSPLSYPASVLRLELFGDGTLLLRFVAIGVGFLLDAGAAFLDDGCCRRRMGVDDGLYRDRIPTELPAVDGEYGPPPSHSPRLFVALFRRPLATFGRSIRTKIKHMTRKRSD